MTNFLCILSFYVLPSAVTLRTQRSILLRRWTALSDWVVEVVSNKKNNKWSASWFAKYTLRQTASQYPAACSSMSLDYRLHRSRKRFVKLLSLALSVVFPHVQILRYLSLILGSPGSNMVCFREFSRFQRNFPRTFFLTDFRRIHSIYTQHILADVVFCSAKANISWKECEHRPAEPSSDDTIDVTIKFIKKS